jgi:hypothetical protein
MELGERAAPSAAPAPAPAPAPPPAAEQPPAPPRPILAIEPPFRLDRRVIPKEKSVFLADLADRTRWNTGGMGTLVAELPPVPGHPAPKVIIDVAKGGGGLSSAEIQRVLRRNFWIKVVECYGLAAYKEPKLRGTASLTIAIAPSGAIGSARVKQTSFNEPEVPRCLAERVKGIALPKAKKRSSASVDIQIGPGDEPMPPPASLIVPGDGELTPDQMRAVVEAALPAFEACYRPALAYAPELWGRLGIRFHVTEKGKTDEAFEVESQFPDERVKLCVLREARKLVFPKPAGGDLRFIVPLRFSSDRSPAS